METTKRIEFTKEMKKDYTILIPNMLPVHFRLVVDVFRNDGYKVELLANNSFSVIEKGLKYVHNDTCYPALLVIGQMLDALENSKYDLNKVALLITQTGGGCRASNYIHLLRKGLEKAGLSHIPVISLNMSGLEKNSGFKLTPVIALRALGCIVYGDLLMLLKNQIEPYELEKGNSDQLVKAWSDKLISLFVKNKGLLPVSIKRISKEIVNDFANIPIKKTPKLKVGVVGEIYVKYAPLGNNDLEKFLLSQDCEIMVPGLMGFMLFKTDNRMEDIILYGGKKLKYLGVKALRSYLLSLEKILIDVVKNKPQFQPPGAYLHLKELVKDYVGYGNKMGEGWLLTAEMLELIEVGYSNIVCTQPFGCLPNHITGKGMIRKITENNPIANIVPIDYDPGATKVNQENRIKLMLAVGREKISK
ncbi:MAG: 2-hydroxyglutaryl-CoA dehydratase [Erysipelotrichaceae bacterium]